MEFAPKVVALLGLNFAGDQERDDAHTSKPD